LSKGYSTHPIRLLLQLLPANLLLKVPLPYQVAMPSSGRRRALSPSVENGQATLITTPIGIAHPRRPGLIPSIIRREAARSRRLVNGPNELKVISKYTAYRTT
jgi:hypothetical protein